MVLGAISIRRAKLMSLTVMAVLALGCPREAARPTPILGAPMASDPDELELWADAETFYQYVREHHGVYEDAALEQYLGEVVARLLPHLNASNALVRLQIVRDPFLNAFALPNGIIYLHAGIF